MSRAEQRDQTRRTLLQEGRKQFASAGYSAVGLAQIVSAVGVTKGAFYHHFQSKEDLFRAVLTEIQQEVATRVAQVADAEPDPWDQLVAGCHAFLAASADPDVQQIMLIDAPAVLGWNEWRALDEAASARHLTEALTHLMKVGVIATQPVEPLARLLSGAMNEAALWLAATPDPTALATTKRALTTMLQAFRTTPPAAPSTP
ncbi:TetR/AcrR family transcriptional regulator [Nonomuraea soli]|uniref:TetR/AcrR family transcriptional regulator n=1 Tax=Nonomuraea soli TaxID=1032476 RepID=UPI0015EBD879|nr:TetR/AcrR family transcriptional regulator [Nonomuraea soli]